MKATSEEARRITAERQSRNWSQARLAREAGVSENTVLNMENGRRTQATKLEAMRNALGLAAMDRSIDTRGIPDDVLLFLRHAAGRLSAMAEVDRTRVLADLYPRIIGAPSAAERAHEEDVAVGTAAYHRGRAAATGSDVESAVARDSSVR